MKITNLPCEIVEEILGHLDKVQDLKAPLLSCRLFHDAYTQRPRLAQHIVRKQIPKQLLPYAVVLIYARRTRPFELRFNALSLTPEDVDALVFSSTFAGAVVSTSSFQTLSIPQLMAMAAAHELIADFAFLFAEKAWTSMSDTLNATMSTKSMPSHLDLSQKEWLRFCRCFYRVELYHDLFTIYEDDEVRNVHVTQGNVSLESEIQSKMKVPLGSGPAMLADLAPWEVEQLGAAIEYLSNRFVAAAAEALSNDVIKHHYSYTNKWLCQGLLYLRNFEEKSNFEKRDLIDGELRLFPSIFYLGLRLYIIDWSEIRHDTKLDALLQDPSLADIDADDGPRKGLDCISPRAIMENRYEGLRERAYVFWDHERLEKYSICSAISSNLPTWASVAQTQRTDE